LSAATTFFAADVPSPAYAAELVSSSVTPIRICPVRIVIPVRLTETNPMSNQDAVGAVHPVQNKAWGRYERPIAALLLRMREESAKYVLQFRGASDSLFGGFQE
jgi:hypothetical protein